MAAAIVFAVVVAGCGGTSANDAFKNSLTQLGNTMTRTRLLNDRLAIDNAINAGNTRARDRALNKYLADARSAVPGLGRDAVIKSLIAEHESLVQSACLVCAKRVLALIFSLPQK